MRELAARIIDLDLMKNKGMMLLSVANIFGMVGYYVPIIFSTSRAMQFNVEDFEAVLILSVFGKLLLLLEKDIHQQIVNRENPQAFC